MNLKIPFLIIALLLVIIFSGCQKDESLPPDDQILQVTEVNSSDCKNTTKSAEEDLRSIKLKAVTGNNLSVTFVNAVFNCCPGEIGSNATIENGILKVYFNESMHMCNCVCPYDLECVIDGMQNRKYKIEVYAGGDTPDAEFSFTFSERLDMTFDISD